MARALCRAAVTKAKQDMRIKSLEQGLGKRRGAATCLMSTGVSIVQRIWIIQSAEFGRACDKLHDQTEHACSSARVPASRLRWPEPGALSYHCTPELWRNLQSYNQQRQPEHQLQF